MNRFQYKIVGLMGWKEQSRMIAAFADLGMSGWDFVGVYHLSYSMTSHGMATGFAVFKRPVADGEEPTDPWAEWIASKDVGSEKGKSAEEAYKADPMWGAW